MHFSVEFVLKIFYEQLQAGLANNCYFIKSPFTFFDVDEFINQVEVTHFATHIRINEIFKKAEKILSLYNNEFDKIEKHIKGDKGITITFPNGEIRIVARPIQCFFIAEDKTRSHISEENYSEFFKQEPEVFTNRRFAERATRIINFVTALKVDSKNNDSTSSNNEEIIEDKIVFLSNELKNLGFFELEMVKQLSIDAQTKLIEHLSGHELPYKVAMISFLGFPEQLKSRCDCPASKVNSLLAEVFGTDDRSIKGNLNVLKAKSKENKERYTSHLHKEDVEKSYKNIK